MRIKLTKLQIEILSLLNQGEILELDGCNMAHIGDKNLTAQTRYFLSDKQLISKIKHRHYKISVKGKRILMNYTK